MKEKIIRHENGAYEIQKDNQTFYICYNNGDRVWWNLLDGAMIVVRIHTHDEIVWDIASQSGAPLRSCLVEAPKQSVP